MANNISSYLKSSTIFFTLFFNIYSNNQPVVHLYYHNGSKHLLDIALKKYGKYNKVEEQLLFCIAEKTTLTINPPATSNQCCSVDTIHASFVNWLCLDADVRPYLIGSVISIDGAYILGSVRATYSQLPFSFHLFNCVVTDELILSFSNINSIYIKASRIKRMIGQCMQINNIFNCESSLFTDGIRLDNLTVNGNFSIINDTIKGEANLPGLTIKGSFLIDGSLIENPNNTAIDITESNVNGSFSIESSEINGTIEMVECSIGKSFYIEKSNFIKSSWKMLMAERINVEGILTVNDMKSISGCINISYATIKNGIFWRNNPSNNNFLLNLNHSKTSVFGDVENNWPNHRMLEINGFEYTQIGEGSPIDYKTRKRWLHLQDSIPFNPQPYEQLSKVLSNTGHFEDSKKIKILKEIDLIKYGQLSLFDRSRNILYGVLTGFGYRSENSLFFSVLLIIIGTIIFRIGFKRGYFQRCSNEKSPNFNSFLFSLDVFLPVLDLHQEKNWRIQIQDQHRFKFLFISIKKGTLSYIYFLFQIMSGWVLTTLFLVSISGLITKS
jgi:hypothetical protein